MFASKLVNNRVPLHNQYCVPLKFSPFKKQDRFNVIVVDAGKCVLLVNRKL